MQVEDRIALFLWDIRCAMGLHPWGKWGEPTQLSQFEAPSVRGRSCINCGCWEYQSVRAPS